MTTRIVGKDGAPNFVTCPDPFLPDYCSPLISAMHLANPHNNNKREIIYSVVRGPDLRKNVFLRYTEYCPLQ